MTKEEEGFINFGSRDELRELADRLARERDEARKLARGLMPVEKLADPWSVRWHERIRAKHPWLQEPDVSLEE